MMHTVVPIPCLRDNYMWAIFQTHPSRQCILVDPGDASVALHFLQKNQLVLHTILVTHHHWDHVDGIEGIVSALSASPGGRPAVYGPHNEVIPCRTHPVHGGQCIALPYGPNNIRVFSVPGHTKGHVAYYIEGVGLFSGDTLFAAGCGRAFEGTTHELYHSLRRLTQLPGNTLLYCGHEYTENNLAFAASILPHDVHIASRRRKVRQQRAQGQPSLPCPLDEEFNTNLFLRSHLPSVRRVCEGLAKRTLTTPEAVFTFLREWKDHYQ